jgi:thymidine kinase
MTDRKCGKLIVITGPMFSGKCLKKGTDVIMCDGHTKKVEEVKVGDQLMGDDSTPRTVLSTTQGVGSLYKVTPSFGDPYVVNDQHILSLKCSYTLHRRGNQSMKYIKGKILDIPVQEAINESKSFKSYYKGFRVGVDFPVQMVPLDPYILGVWLGDGTSSYAQITTTDPEILAEWTRCAEFHGLTVNPHGKYGYHAKCGKLDGNNPLLHILTDLGIRNNKHIPHIYMANSRENRLQLLAGLLDTDGYWDNKRHAYEISQKNELLANQIVFLARSLGMVSYVHATDKSCLYKGERRTGIYHRIHISGSCLHEIPCRLEYKRALFHTNRNDLLVGITIQPDGEGDYCGFTLDGNGRFLLGDFTVTHNSTELQRHVKRLELAGKKCLIIKHASDTRYGKSNECCTHDLKTMPAIPVKYLWDIKEKCDEYDVIGIDEAQFYPEIVEFVEELIEKMNKIVIIAALDGTYEGKPFGRVTELLPLSDQFTKLTAVCQYCGNDAPFTVRRSDFIDQQGIIEVVGGSDLYESVCRNCRAKRIK